MANNFKLKLGDVSYVFTSLTSNDIAKIQGAIQGVADNAADIAALQTAVAEGNSLQHIIAGSDLGAQDAVIAGLTPGALYDCYYNAAGRYLTYNSATGTFSDAGAGAETPDAVPAQIKVFPALTATTVATPRVYEMTSSFDGFVKTTGAQSIAGVKTFSDVPLVTGSQALATMGDNEVVKGSTLLGVDTRLQAAEGSITTLTTSNATKLSASAVASEPADSDLSANVITIWPASDLLTAAV